MSTLNLCPLCGAPAPPPPAVSCRFCRYTWVVPGAAPSSAAPSVPSVAPALPSATFAGLTFDEVLARATLHLGTTEDLYLSPGIPAEKEQSARSVHAAHLPADEPIAALFDATLLGGGDEGYLLTARRFCWKDAFANPQALPWRAVETHAVRAEGDDVLLANGRIPGFDAEHAARLTALLLELASEAQRRAPPGVGAPHEASEGPLDVLRRHVGVDDALYYSPAIPSKKETNARRVHNLGGDEPVLALFDATVFGSADEGFVVSTRRFCWTDADGAAKQAHWPELRPERLAVEDETLMIDGTAVDTGEIEPGRVRSFLLAMNGTGR